MIQCPRCGRHHLSHEPNCPFCQRESGGLVRKLRGAAVVASAMVLVACYGGAPGTWEYDSVPDLFDVDNDGWFSDEDCDDENPDIYPGAEEICDEVDNDCDGQVDEDAGNTYFPDVDGDGYGDEGADLMSCELPEGYVEYGEDCDDEDAAINPDAIEVCDDKVDNDCDDDTDMDDEDCVP